MLRFKLRNLILTMIEFAIDNKEVAMVITENGMNIANMQGSTYYRQNSASVSKVQKESITQTQQMQTEIDKSNEEQKVEEQKQKLNELAQQLNKELNPLNTNVTFGFSEDIEGLYVTVSERDTNRIIRKIPSDEAMELMAKMKEVVGIIFNKQA
ncbi:FlaG family protein [Helicobacter rodentium]|uniref:FlaG family protein n=4 Tax=Helicobacter rodentium TaxID=59617 RepID=UPI0025A6154E|nr:FlaG family protein [Helicobacter rodentium]